MVTKAISLLFIAVLLAGALVVVPSMVSANPDICTWTNTSTDGLWSTAANWSCGHAPASGDSVIFDSTSDTPVTVNVVTASLTSMNIAVGYTSTIILALDQCGDPCTPFQTWGAVTFDGAATLDDSNGCIFSVGSFSMTGGLGTLIGNFNFASACQGIPSIHVAGTFDTRGGNVVQDGLELLLHGTGNLAMKAGDTVNLIDIFGDTTGGSAGVGTTTMQTNIKTNSAGESFFIAGNSATGDLHTFNTNGFILDTNTAGFGYGNIFNQGTLNTQDNGLKTGNFEVANCGPVGVVGAGCGVMNLDTFAVRSVAFRATNNQFSLVNWLRFDNYENSGGPCCPPANSGRLDQNYQWTMKMVDTTDTVQFEIDDLAYGPNGDPTLNPQYRLYRNGVLLDTEGIGTGSTHTSARFTITGGWSLTADVMSLVGPGSAYAQPPTTQPLPIPPECIGNTVTFTDNRPEAANAVVWIWDWGDGQSTTTSSPTASHNYANADVYTITVRVQDKSGRIDTFVGSVDLTTPGCSIFTAAQIVGPYLLALLIIIAFVLLLQALMGKKRIWLTRALLAILIVGTIVIAIFIFYGWTPELPGGIRIIST